MLCGDHVKESIELEGVAVEEEIYTHRNVQTQSQKQLQFF